jgi:uncharacterized membrane protein
MFQISDHSVVNFVELTSDMLEYNGKLKLEKYMIFDPTIKFNYALKQKILEMSYDKKVEIFFNTQTYNRKIVNSIEIKQEEEKEKQKAKKEKKEQKKIDANDIIQKERDQSNASFEFIIQCIFCTGLPLSNYYKNMEFYDLKATKEKVIAKRSFSVFDLINPTPVKKCFSYIKLNGKKYTVTGITWINDVLNHPVYADIITKYKKYDHERKKVDPTKNEKELNTKLNSLILDIYDLNVFDVKPAIVTQYDSSRHKILLESRDKIQTLFKDIKSLKTRGDKPALLDLNISDPDADQFINGYSKIKREYEKEKNESNQPHRVRELVITYNGIIQKSSSDTKHANNHSKLKEMLDAFDENEAIKKFKSEIKSICSIYSDQEFNNIISNTQYYPTLIKYFRTLKMLFLKEDMYDIILNDLTYQDRNPSEIKEMDALIEKEVKNYYDYRQAFKNLDEDRVISNVNWKKEADVINGEAGFIESTDLKKTESLFDIVLKCDKNNKACTNKKIKDVVHYLEVGLEQINRKDKTSFTYEAYINLEVAEGVFDESNYHKLMCPYIDNVLGDAYDEMIRKEGKNIVMRNRVFIKALQPEANKKMTDPHKPPPPPNTTNKKKPPKMNKNPKRKNGGGTKKRKRKRTNHDRTPE